MIFAKKKLPESSRLPVKILATLPAKTPTWDGGGQGCGVSPDSTVPKLHRFGGKSYRQKKVKPIAVRATGAPSQLVMED